MRRVWSSLVVVVLTSFGLAAPSASADTMPASCAGTYLIQEAGGAKDFWTFAADGAFVVRTFEDGEDPLDPTTDTGDPLASDTFTGRRVQARP